MENINFLFKIAGLFESPAIFRKRYISPITGEAMSYYVIDILKQHLFVCTINKEAMDMIVSYYDENGTPWVEYEDFGILIIYFVSYSDNNPVANIVKLTRGNPDY